MGSISNMSRCDRFIQEFQEDILRVYGLPASDWLVGQWLDDNLDGRVELRVDLRLGDGSHVPAIIAAPTFYDANASDLDNVDLLTEAMDVKNGLERADIVKRMLKAKLIAKEV